MPIENERKYVLNLNKHIESNMAALASNWFDIKQGYLLVGKGRSVRIRQAKRKDGLVHHKMTYKQGILAPNNCPQSVEIEQEMSNDDWDKLWPTAGHKLYKRRYVIDGWEIDFFRIKDDNLVYFAMAEIELPDTQLSPDFIPGFINENLLHEVTNGDCRFSSRKLSDPKYAQKIMNKLMARSLV